MDKFHVWITGKPSDNVEFAAALTARGIKYSYGGLRRLLGAPIGTPSFCVQAEGHLDSLTTAATDFIDQIMQIDHAHAQYLLLRYCATNSLQHCARLKSPTLLRGFASRHRYAVQEAIRNVLHADNLNDSQRVQIGLPEYNGGLGCTTTADVLDPLPHTHTNQIWNGKSLKAGEYAKLMPQYAKVCAYALACVVVVLPILRRQTPALTRTRI